MGIFRRDTLVQLGRFDKRYLSTQDYEMKWTQPLEEFTEDARDYLRRFSLWSNGDVVFDHELADALAVEVQNGRSFVAVNSAPRLEKRK